MLSPEINYAGKIKKVVTVHAFYGLFSFALSGLYSGCRNLSGGLRHPAMRSSGPSGLIRKRTRERLQKVKSSTAKKSIFFCRRQDIIFCEPQ